MKVDISPKRPPISSCTAAAPAGSGSDGGGSSVSQRSMRRIMSSPLVWNESKHACPTRPRTNLGCGGRSHGYAQRVSGAPPEDIWEDALDEGERRLDRRLPGLAASSFAGGADVLFGLVALFVTSSALQAVMPETTAHMLASSVFGIALVLITLGRAELFTENFLIPVGSVFAGRSSKRM